MGLCLDCRFHYAKRSDSVIIEVVLIIGIAFRSLLNFVIGSDQIPKPHRIERPFDNEAVSPTSESSFPVLRNVTTCENEHDNVRIDLLDLLRETQAILPG